MPNRTLPKAVLGLCAFLVLLPLSSWLGGCDGSATQTTTGQGLYGTLVDPMGNPVADAKVLAWASGAPEETPIGQFPTPAALTRTDARGHYNLEGLDAGLYTVFGEKGQGASSVLIPRVRYATGEFDLGVDTLTPPGALSGKVSAGGKPLPDVFCYIPGSSFIAMTDSAGAFTLPKVPAGTYRFKYTSSGYASAVDSPVVVVSGAVTVLPDRALDLDVTLQPPAPKGLALSVDPATGVVTAIWNRVQVEDVDGYQIEVRLAHDSSDLFGNRLYAFYGDTVLRDSVSRNRFSGEADPWGSLDTLDLEYRIRTLDKDGNTSPSFSPVVKQRVVRPEKLRTTVATGLRGGPSDAFQCLDSLTFVASFSNPAADTATFLWSVTSTDPSGDVYDQLFAKSDYHFPQVGKTDTFTWWWGLGRRNDWVGQEGYEQTGRQVSLHFLLEVRFRIEELAFDESVKRVIDVDLSPTGCFRVHPARPMLPNEPAPASLK